MGSSVGEMLAMENRIVNSKWFRADMKRDVIECTVSPTSHDQIVDLQNNGFS